MNSSNTNNANALIRTDGSSRRKLVSACTSALSLLALASAHRWPRKPPRYNWSLPSESRLHKRPRSKLKPIAPATAAAAANKPALRDEEKALLKADYDKLTPEEREAMVAAYKDLGIDLLAAVGATPAAAAATTAKNDLLKAHPGTELCTHCRQSTRGPRADGPQSGTDA